MDEKKLLSDSLISKILAKLLFMRGKVKVPGHPKVQAAINDYISAKEKAKQSLNDLEASGYKIPPGLRKYY